MPGPDAGIVCRWLKFTVDRNNAVRALDPNSTCFPFVVDLSKFWPINLQQIDVIKDIGIYRVLYV